MASIGVNYKTVSAEVASTSTSFAEVAETDALTNGKTYYVVAHGLVEGSSNSDVFEWRLVDRTNSDAVLSNSTQIREPTQADKTQGYHFVGKFTAGSGGGGLAFEQKSASGETVRTQYLSLMLLDIDNLSADDYFYNNNTSDTALTDSFQSFATVTKSSLTASDKWLVFGWQATATDDVSHNTEMKLYCSDPSGTEDEPLISFEGEDLTEVLGFTICRAYTMTGAGATWTIKSRMDSALPADANNHLESTLFGIRLSAFENSTFSYTSALQATTATSWQQLARQTLTPDSTGDVIAVTCAVFDGDSTNRKSFARTQVDGSSVPNTQPDTEYQCNTNDFSELLPIGGITKYSGSASTLATVDFDAKKESGASYGWQNTTLALFTTEIAVTNTNQVYTAVASQTYNSGDVAGQTYSSGDVASEVQPT
ncbi:MAG: hypothetical protein CL524_13100 [Aequorivita sp.]|nr:hypothetical protein [Aequorivita sp.]